MDAPQTTSWEALIEEARDKDEWRAKVRAIKDMIDVTAIMKRGKNKKRKGQKGKGKSKKNKKKPKKKKRLIGTGIDAFWAGETTTDDSQDDDDGENGGGAARQHH